MQTNNQISHTLPTLLAYPAFLAGHRTVDEAIQDRLMVGYLSAFLEQDMANSLTTEHSLHALFAAGTDESLGELCASGASQLPSFILPILLERLASNSDVHRLAFLLAAYGHYLWSSVSEAGADAGTDATALHPSDWAKAGSHDVLALFNISLLEAARLQTYSHFVAMYKSYRAQIAKHGIAFLLRQMAYNRLATS